MPRSTGHRPVATTFVKSLVYQFYRIAFVHHAFDQDCTINARHTIVSLRYFF